MILHYFYQKENKDKKQVTKIYSRIVKLSNNFAKKNIFIKRGDFQTSFEIFSLFLIILSANGSRSSLQHTIGASQVSQKGISFRRP